MTRLRRVALVPLAIVSVGACFATRNDVRLLQADVATVRAEAARADSVHRAQMLAMSRAVGTVADSLRATNAFLARFAGDVSRFQGDLATSMHSFGQQLIAVQEQMGQNQKRLQDIRADFEAKSNELAVSAASGQPPGATGAPAAAVAAGPRELLRSAWDQFDGNRLSAARSGFEAFLAQFPTHEEAPRALFGIAQTYDFEARLAAADSVYQLVAERYPASDQAPRAVYKRAMNMLKGGPTQVARARTLFQQIVDKYPKSPEATLARERLTPP